ncbi:MAG: hypothetical protein HY216_05980 [Candidatus Rokubacteria bacterium]|nr:hypothetical protein [Candidatus Rokubacteria bacterium]
MRQTMFVLGALVLGIAIATPAAAAEVRTPISASMLLHAITAPNDSRDRAFNEALREDGPRPLGQGEVLPDGSVRYGSGRSSVTVTVRNPCPPGEIHYEPSPLPGRRARN